MTCPSPDYCAMNGCTANGCHPSRQPDATQRLIRTVASLNPDAGEIGAGMLAQIVSEARRIQANANSDLTAALELS